MVCLHHKILLLYLHSNRSAHFCFKIHAPDIESNRKQQPSTTFQSATVKGKHPSERHTARVYPESERRPKKCWKIRHHHVPPHSKIAGNARRSSILSQFNRNRLFYRFSEEAAPAQLCTSICSAAFVILAVSGENRFSSFTKYIGANSSKAMAIGEDYSKWMSVDWSNVGSLILKMYFGGKYCKKK